MSDYDLAESVKGLGILVPLIRNKRTGHMIDGKHRSAIDPKAPIWDIDIPEEYESIARLTINKCRRDMDQDEEEWKDTLSKVVGIQGKKPDEIAKLTGIHVSTIYRHMPQSLKPSGEKISEAMREKSEISRQSLASARPPLTTQETPKVECQRCHTYTSEPKTWKNGLKTHMLCESCNKRAILDPLNFHRYFELLEKKLPESLFKKPEHPKTAKPSDFDSYAEKQAHMKVPHSKAEEDLIRKLRDKLRGKGYKVSNGSTICVLATTTDFDIEMPSGKTYHGYVDGAAVHKGKQLDKDDYLRGLLRKERPNEKLIEKTIETGSEKELDEKVMEIDEELKF
jgi:hypothetical protein